MIGTLPKPKNAPNVLSFYISWMIEIVAFTADP